MTGAAHVLDDGPERLQTLYQEFGKFCSGRGRVSEADTRANVLDRILHDILLWPREAVHRETFVNPGFLDYELRLGRPVVVLEAKASDATFVIPFQKQKGSRRLRLSGSLRGNSQLQDAVTQVQRYCVDQGARYAVATNGYSFVIFQAVTEGKKWRSGYAVIFNSPRDVEDDFTTFWNLLSYDSVSNGGLDNYFRGADAAPREYHRPIAKLLEADATYGRNPLTLALHPYVERFFGDIGSQDTIEILDHCYVHSKPTQVIDKELKLVIRDHIPHFAGGARQLSTSEDAPGGDVGRHIRAVVDHSDRGSVAVLMGGIGSGKSTFLKRFFKVVAPDLVTDTGRAVLIYLDFLGAPDSPTELDNLIWREVALRLSEQDSSLMKRPALEAMFEQRLRLTRELFSADPEILEKRITAQLFDLANNNREFANAALAHLARLRRLPLVVFDNVDQLGIDAQASIFTSAQFFALHLGCLSVLVLREESYCTAQMQKQLTAYTIRPYHLSSPSFRQVIKLRLDFAANYAATDTPTEDITIGSQELLDFFHVLRRSVFSANHNITRLIEAVSFGNMRLALKLFNNFITSGATNLAKILSIYRDFGNYTVPFHEFVKSVMLGEFRYYKETRSELLNAFHVTTARNPSHFTTLRILHYLAGSYDTSKTGEEFVGLDSLLNAIVSVFDNEDDCVKTIMRLIELNRQLVELDTRRTDSLAGAASIRITSSGRYYMEYLVKSFAYLDLVWQDTPFSSLAISDEQYKMIHNNDVELRFARVDAFLKYLESEETQELLSRNLPLDHESFYGPFIPLIRRQFESEKRAIRQKLRKGDADTTEGGD